MRFEGRLFKVDRRWAVEVPILGVVSQGRTRSDALKMIADAVESLVNQKGFTITVFEGIGEHFEIGASNQTALTSLLLRRMRLKAGLSLAEVAARLGARSLNAYARYEQGRTAPSVQKLSELLSAVVPDRDFVLVESRARG